MSKIKTEYYNRRMVKLFETNPESKSVKLRYRTLRYLLLEKHPFLRDLPINQVTELLKECVTLDRKLRLATQGLEEETKKILSQEYQLEELGVEVGIEGDLKKLTTL